MLSKIIYLSHSLLFYNNILLYKPTNNLPHSSVVTANRASSAMNIWPLFQIRKALAWVARQESWHPVWFSQASTMQAASSNVSPRVTDQDIRYTLKPDFLYVIRLAGANQRQDAFTLSEVTFLFTQYILSRRNLIIDPRNKLVALVENDPLGKAFGVKAFHRDQALRLIHTQISPVLPVPGHAFNVLASSQKSNGPHRNE